MENVNYELDRITLNYNWMRAGQHDCSGQANYTNLRIIMTYCSLGRFKLVYWSIMTSVHNNVSGFLSHDNSCAHRAQRYLQDINYKFSRFKIISKFSILYFISYVICYEICTTEINNFPLVSPTDGLRFTYTYEYFSRFMEDMRYMLNNTR